MIISEYPSTQFTIMLLHCFSKKAGMSCSVYIINFFIIHSLTHAFNSYLLSPYYMPDSVLGAGDTMANQTDKDPALTEFTLQYGN